MLSGIDPGREQIKRPGFWSELKRRNVFRSAIAYSVAAVLILQVAWMIIVTPHQLPAWVMKMIVGLLALGFPLALVSAWSFQITPQGVKWRDDVWPHNPTARRPSRILVRITIVLAVIAIVLLGIQIRRDIETTSRADRSPIGALLPVINKSIAVLPFDNWSQDTTNDFFTDAVQEEILDALARIGDLKVISRPSVSQYPPRAARNLEQIRHQLGVAYVLEGSVDRSANHIRLNAQLIDTHAGTYLWAETYERELSAVFAVQNDIVRAVVEQLHLKLLPREKLEIEQPPTSSAEAYDLYCRSNILAGNVTYSVANFGNVNAAAELLQQAIALDPKFYLAYLQLNFIHENVYFLGWDHTPARRALADAALAAAARLRPEEGRTHLAQGYHFYHDLDYERAQFELRQAQRTLPNTSRVFELLAYIQRREGHWDESLSNHRKALELDPRNTHLDAELAWTYEALRRYPELKAAWQHDLEIDPTDIHSQIGMAKVEFSSRGNIAPLEKVVHDVLGRDARSAPVVVDMWLVTSMCRRDPAEAERALAAIPPQGVPIYSLSFPRPYYEALVHRLRGNVAQARDAFMRARTELEDELKKSPDYANALAVLGLCDAALRQKEDAIREGLHAAELAPVQKNSLVGASVIKILSLIYAWTGEKDLAFAQLDLCARIPGGVTYGELKLDPLFDPLRGDPRFAKILGFLAPKQP